MINKIPIITIDGPSNAGKGTVCKVLAKKLKWNLLDSGAIYRSIAFAAFQSKISIYDEKSLCTLCSQLKIRFQYKENKLNILLNNKNISQEIRNSNISNIASQISQFSQVRKMLLEYQRKFYNNPGLIADGRDMGTILFPEAPIKIFLYASPEKRALRYIQQLQKKGYAAIYNNILSEIKIRDKNDRNRIFSPLVPASDALMLDSTNLTVKEVITKIFIYIKHVLKNN